MAILNPLLSHKIQNAFSNNLVLTYAGTDLNSSYNGINIKYMLSKYKLT